MKKDSFTFSDKLKKSKTLPLSKRLPSRVGGEVKAKRTLFERAQRDLPFIIVAALALLLLPFLSRESGDIDTASVVWPNEGGEEFVTDINGTGTGEDEIGSLSTYRNPLDLIIRHGEGDGSARDTVDTFGAGSDGEESSEYGSSSRSSYGSEEYSTSPATSRYGKTAKRTVRSSITRTPTSIGSFRPGSMVSPGSGSGVGHSMAFGSRAKDGAPKVQGTGVRPVALQPLTAAGKGRDLTGGDNLYAEAARSIGAMNTPGAKQALMDAQLKDLDGKPLGDTKAAAADAGGKGPGAPGSLANNWNHSPLKPWWWDMMKQRSQMRWELWHYNWEKMASDSLIKLTAGLASCLIAGGPDFGVSNFLGKPGGEEDICCKVNGSEICASTVSQFAQTTTGSGKDKEVRTDGIEGLKLFCPLDEKGNLDRTQVYIKETGRKNFIDVRLRCLGLKLSELKNKFENKRSGVCHLDNDPMSVDITVERNGKHRTNLVKHMGYYIVSTKQLNSSVDENACKANKDDKGNPDGTFSCDCVTYIKKADYGRNILPEIDEEKDGELKAVVVYKVGSYTLLDDAYLKTDDVVVDDKKYNETFGVAKALTESSNTQCLTEERLQDIMKPLGQWRTKDYHNTRLNEIARCPAGSFRHTYYEPVKLAPEYSTTQSMYDNVYMEDCRTHDVFIEKVPDNHRFTTTIQRPGKTTIAYVIEHVQGASYEAYAGEEALADNTGWIVRQRIVYSEEKNMNTHWMKKNPDGSITFIGEAEVGLASTETTDANSGADDKKTGRGRALPGFGKIIWVTTNETKDYGKDRGSFVKEPESSLLFPHAAKAAVCNYRWGCGQGNTCPLTPDNSNRVCYKVDADGNPVLDENGKKIYYEAFQSSTGYMLIKKPLTRVEEDTLERLDLIQRCEPICKLKDNGGYQFPHSPSGATVPEEELEEAYIDPNCPDCNPNPVKILPVTGLVCVDPEKQREPCPCIKVDNPITPEETPIPGTLYVRSDITTVNPQEVELPVTPICYKKAIATGNIYVRDLTDGSAGERVNPDQDIVNMLLSKPQNVRDALCPLCNPKDEGPSLVCVDPKKGNEPCPCIKVDNPVTPAGINPLYIKSDITPVDPQEVKLPVTPICYLKAIAEGNIYVRNDDGSAGERVNPDKDIVKMLLSKPRNVQDEICPYCGPTQQEIVEAKKKCAFVFKDVFDHNVFMYSRGYEDVNKAAADIAECVRLTDIAEINVVGHADKSDQSDLKDETTCPVGDDSCDSTKNNISLSEDRALYITNAVLNKLYPIFTGQVRFAVDFISNPNAASKTFGKERYSNYKDSYGSGDRVVTFRVIGRGDADATVPPVYNSKHKATNKEAMAKDRYVEILPYSYESD